MTTKLSAYLAVAEGATKKDINAAKEFLGKEFHLVEDLAGHAANEIVNAVSLVIHLPGKGDASPVVDAAQASGKTVLMATPNGLVPYVQDEGH